MSAAELVGDLAVLYVELAAIDVPYEWRTDPARSHFAYVWRFAERLLRLAVDAGIAVAQEPVPPRDAVAALSSAVQTDPYLLFRLHEVLCERFMYVDIEHPNGDGPESWEELCLFRSGVA